MIKKFLLYALPFFSFPSAAMFNYRTQEEPVRVTLTAGDYSANPTNNYDHSNWEPGPSFSVSMQQQTFQQKFHSAPSDAISMLENELSQASKNGLYSKDFLLTKLDEIESQMQIITDNEHLYNELSSQAAQLHAQGHVLTRAESIRYLHIEFWHNRNNALLEEAQKCKQFLEGKINEIRHQDRIELANFKEKALTRPTKWLEAQQNALQIEKSATYSKISLATCQRDAKIANHTKLGNAWRAIGGGEPHADSFVVAKRKEINHLDHQAQLLDKKLELLSQELTLRKNAIEKEAADIATLAKIKDEPTQFQLKTEVSAQDSAQQAAPQAVSTKTILADTAKKAAEISARYPQEIDIQQSAKNVIQLSEATLDMISTPQHQSIEGATNPNAEADAALLAKCGRTMQSFAKGGWHSVLEFSDMANQVITDPQKAALDLYTKISNAIENYTKQREEIYNQCTGDFSLVDQLLKDASESKKLTYKALAHQYRCEYAHIAPTEKNIEAWVARDIIWHEGLIDQWETIKNMSSEELAYHAGKIAAETALIEGAVRIAGSALQVVRAEGKALCLATKEGIKDIAATAGAKATQATEKIALTADQLGMSLKQAASKANPSTKVATAGAEGGVLKTTLKHPDVARACEEIAAQRPQMKLAKDAGKAAESATENRLATVEEVLVKPLGKGSTGRTVALSLEEQLAMKEVMSNPLKNAKNLSDNVVMTDPRWPQEAGWAKMQKTVTITDQNGNMKKINVHYVYNKRLNAFDDFKFK